MAELRLNLAIPLICGVDGRKENWALNPVLGPRAFGGVALPINMWQSAEFFTMLPTWTLFHTGIASDEQLLSVNGRW